MVLYTTKHLALTQRRGWIGTGATFEGDDAEVAATHSRGNRDGLDLGSSMVRCGLSAALVVWLQSRCPVPSRLRCTRLHCRGAFSSLLLLAGGRRNFDQMSL